MSMSMYVHVSQPAEKKASKGKKPAPAPYSKEATKAPAKEPTGPVWEKKPKNFGIGGYIRECCSPHLSACFLQPFRVPAPLAGAFPF